MNDQYPGLNAQATFAPWREPSRLTFTAAIVLAFALFVSAPAWATSVVLSGMFDGSEAVIAPLVIDPSLSAERCDSTASGYRQSTFEVSESGTYRFNDGLGDLNYYGRQCRGRM